MPGTPPSLYMFISNILFSFLSLSIFSASLFLSRALMQPLFAIFSCSSLFPLPSFLTSLLLSIIQPDLSLSLSLSLCFPSLSHRLCLFFFFSPCPSLTIGPSVFYISDKASSMTVTSNLSLQLLAFLSSPSATSLTLCSLSVTFQSYNWSLLCQSQSFLSD